MPIYRYKGYKTGGGEAAGTLEADGLRDAAHKVKELGIYPRDIQLFSPGSRLAFLRRGINAEKNLPSFTRQLGVLVRAGVPLLEALRALSDEGQGPWKSMLVDIRERVMGGASLSRAMQEHSKVFHDYYTFMVAAGEESGTLDNVLARLASFLEIQNEVREKMRNASMYPMIMAFVAVMVLVLLFSFVIPKVVAIFETRGENLPLMTQALILISNLVSGYWWAMLMLGGLAVWGARKLALKHRERLDHALMGMFGSLYLARFTRTLGFLMEGNLPVIKALELAGRTSGNQWLAGVAQRAVLRVSEGAGLSASLEGLPPVFLELVSTGERSGNLAGVLNTAADGYEADFDRMVQRSLALVEPVMILTMAVVVGFIVFSVLLPMFQLNQIIGR